MVTLPSIHELGLWGTPGGASTGSPSLGRPQISTPSRSETYSQRHVKTEDRDSLQLLTQPTYGHRSRSSVSTTCNVSSTSYWGAQWRTSSTFTLQPRVKTEQHQDLFEGDSLSSDRRRGSADSVSSTPSLSGSFTSSISSNDSISPALTPSIPQEFPNSAYFWDLGSKELLLAQAPVEYDSWSKLYLRDALSSRTPRRFQRASKAPDAPRGSLQPAYKVQKRERARPKNTGTAHCNEKYTTEENRFLVYFRVDHPLSWQQMEVVYNERFTYGARPHRTDGGLQSQFYRLNTVCPEMTEDKLLVFGPRTAREKENKSIKFNEYDNLTFDCKVREGGKVSLIDRYAEQIVEENWPWIKPEDMREAKKLADLRRPHRLAWEAFKKANPALFSQTEDAKL
ncbi:hypothetical protein CONLIGDRAFT_677041 [Coniochaeta ligniaria NRRL 30616]|uniref:Uncharacterized protein n=1 Tax=Coniochaeta ligniaria NRRL 30616 TaxID=1408157 RepID=A0A1J7JIP1_9PEZI|nr:hypothetical protein CONLIGDRAFT_677041 [Coniochaeta ligniaria NRRL 30616]